jgi:uncharacterized membrane protein YgcG
MWWPALVTVFFPGFGQGLAGRPRRMVAWLAAIVVVDVACAWLVWWVPLHWAICVACAIDAFRLRAATKPKRWLLAVVAIAATFAIAAGVTRFVVESFSIPSSSSSPTLLVGDHVFVEKLSPHVRAIERGELIAFDYPCDPSRQYISRVVALGGESVEIRAARSTSTATGSTRRTSRSAASSKTTIATAIDG